MMKKWSKVTLLAAATAFMLAGVTACFTSVNEDEDEDSSSTPTVDGENGKDEAAGGTTYTLSIDSNSTVKGPAGPTKLDDTVTVYVTESGKSIQAYPSATPPVLKMTSAKANIEKDKEYGLQLTLAADAKITITALTKHNGTAEQWILKGVSSGTSDIDSTGTPAAASKEIKNDTPSQDTTPAELTFASVPKGTYMLGGKSTGGYLFSLKIEYK